MCYVTFCMLNDLHLVWEVLLVYICVSMHEEEVGTVVEAMLPRGTVEPLYNRCVPLGTNILVLVARCP